MLQLRMQHHMRAKPRGSKGAQGAEHSAVRARASSRLPGRFVTFPVRVAPCLIRSLWASPSGQPRCAAMIGTSLPNLRKC